MSNRPNLASLGAHLARKDAPAAQLGIPAVAVMPVETPTKPKDTRVQVLVRMTPSERKALHQIALDQDTTVQALVEETLRDLIRRHGVTA